MSLGINNIPYKHCSYSCIYCQLGRTTHLEIIRSYFFSTKDIVSEVIKALSRTKVNYITFVPDGEPTLDINLGKTINSLKKEVSIPIAVLTNGSLLFREDVKQDLYEADLVSIKIDATSEEVFKKINRPHPYLELSSVLQGILEFSKHYKGKLITETMVISNINDDINELIRIARFIKRLNPHKAYIAIPTRPPAEPWVKPASEQIVCHAYHKFLEHIPNRVELLIKSGEGKFKRISSDPIKDLLSIVSVHPMELNHVFDFLSKAGLDPETILSELIKSGEITVVNYLDKKFIIRKHTNK